MLKRLVASLLLLIMLSVNPTAVSAQSAHHFDNDDLDVLPQFYDLQVSYMNRILDIQDTALSLLSVSDYNIFYDYCEKRLDADWEERRLLRDYAESQKTAVDAYHEKVKANERALIKEVLAQLYKKSGLKATTLEEMSDAILPETRKHRRRAKEVMRRMLMHEMVWHITDCKNALEAVRNGTAEADDFYKASLESYLSLIAEHDRATKKLAERLMQKAPAPRTKPTGGANAQGAND